MKLFPNAKTICLYCPETNVLENLWQFPFLTENHIYHRDSDFVTEFYSLLKLIGEKIKILLIEIPGDGEFDPEILHDFCPEILNLEINYSLL